MTYGVTSTGFVMPTLLDIIDDMSTTAKKLFGSNVDTEVWSSLGMFIRTIAADNLLVWQGQRDLYYVPYLDFAYGQNLDELLAMFVFSRRIAARATGYVAFTGSVGTSVSGSTMVKTLGDDPISFKTVDPLTITEMITNGEFTTDTSSWTAEDNAVLASVAPSPYTLDFTSGGTYEVLIGNTLTGATSGAIAVVSEIILSSGTWAGGDAAGTFYFSLQFGTFVAENLDDTVGGADVCTIAGDSTPVDCSENCLRITCGASDNPYAEQQISVDEYLFYDLSVLVRRGTEATYNVIVYDATNGASIYNSSDDATDDWSTSITERIEMPTGCTTIAIQLKQIVTTGSATTIYFDTVSFVKVSTNIISIDAAIAGNVPADNIVVLESPISGIVSVTNPNATTGGRDKELDAVYRARYKLSTMGVGKATLNAIVSSVLAVSNVSSATIEDNDTAIDYSNRLLNPDFDSDVSHWYAGGSAILSSETGGKDGNCLKVLENGHNDPCAYQHCVVSPGEEYTLTVFIKKGDEATYYVRVWDNDGDAWIDDVGADTGEANTGDWNTSRVKTFTIPAGCYSVEVSLYQVCTSGAGTYILFDVASLCLAPVGLPPHSVRVSVQGGTDDDVAQALLDSVAGGITTYGDESGTGSLDNEQLFTRYFTRPDEITIDVIAVLTTDSTYVGNDVVQSAIIDYIGGEDIDGVIHTGLGAGDDVLYFEIVSAIMDVAGVTNITTLIIEGGTADVSIAATEVAIATTGTTSVTVP